jgi:hypothetical protein
VSILEIFRAGTRPDSKGIERTFTEAQLDEIVDSYNPNNYRAPILEGHDESKPNKGLIGQLRRLGNSLIAVPSTVDKAFKEQVNEGRFPAVSVALYSPEDKANPTPGKWALRHVGFPQVPAVKAMLNPQFEEGSESVAIQFEDLSSEFIDQDEPIKEAEPVAEIEEKKTVDPEIEQLRAEVATLRKQQQETQFNEYLSSLGGKVTPGEKPGLIALMTSLAGDSNITFAEGGATKSQTRLEVFKKSLENREIKIDFNESPDGIEINSPLSALAKAAQEAEAAQKIQFEEKQAGKEISMSEAVARVQKGVSK